MGVSPYDLDLIHTGIDLVMKVQADQGKIVLGRIAPKESTREGYKRVQRTTGFRNAQVYDRGAPIESSRKENLDLKDYYPLLWALGWDVYDYDSDEDVYKIIPQNVTDAALSMMRTQDIEECGLFNNGFDTNFNIVDGQPLFSTAHTGATGVATQSNRPASGNSLDAEAVEAMWALLRGQTDFNGEKLYMTGSFEAWTGSTLAPLMWRIIETEFQAGTPDNDKSYVHTNFRAMESPQLSSTTAHYYKTADDTLHKLRMIEFSPYTVKNLPMKDDLSEKTVVYHRRRAVAEDWHYTAADPGA